VQRADGRGAGHLRSTRRTLLSLSSIQDRHPQPTGPVVADGELGLQNIPMPMTVRPRLGGSIVELAEQIG
jgi:hypothetical protein